MEDSTLSDAPGIELDAEMAQAIADQGTAYGEQVRKFALFIQEYRSSFRTYLIEQRLIQRVTTNVTGFELAAVDGASAVQSHGVGALVAAAAYKATLNAEIQRGVSQTKLVPNQVDIEAFANLLRMHLEFLLLTRDKIDDDQLVILDHSFWGILQAVSRALNVFKQYRRNFYGTTQDLDADAMYLAWKQLFQETLANDGSLLRMLSNKRVISLSKQGISQYFVKMLRDAALVTEPDDLAILSTFNDRLLLRHVLIPGEYMRPQPLYDIIKESSTITSWKRSRFATAFEKQDGPDPFASRHDVLDEIGVPRDDGTPNPRHRQLFVTYYRPHEWSRVYRMEFHELLLASRDDPSTMDASGQGERFQKVLASLRQSIRRDALEPISQFLADLRAKAATRCAVQMLPDQAFYALWERYKDNDDMMDIVTSMLAQERT